MKRETARTARATRPDSDLAADKNLADKNLAHKNLSGENLAVANTPGGGLNRHTITGFLARLFAEQGQAAYLGEPVTMAEHMLQGAMLAEAAGHGDVVIVAALLHDIGHFISAHGQFSMQDDQDRWHEEAGADLLARFFPQAVVDAVRFHVAAKRYLCATEPDYLACLSPASVHSLDLQGGVMGADEAAEFARQPNLGMILTVRRLDDAGKQAGLATPDFGHFAPKIEQLAEQHWQSRTAAGGAENPDA